MEEDRISIIIPIYNSEKWLSRCLNSVIHQTYKNLEIILINDGSTDNSLNVCEKFKEMDNRIKIINKDNEGVSIARNVGIKEATGKYIKFVDSDDWLENKCCELLYNEIKKEETDLVICGLIIVKNNIILRKPYLNKRLVRIHENEKEFEYINKVFASPCNKLYKKDKIKSFFKEDLSSGEDLLFNLSYLKETCKISILEECLYDVCLDNDESLNRKFREDKLDIVLELIKEQIKFCDELYGSRYKKVFFYNMYIEHTHAYFRELAQIYNYKKFVCNCQVT